MWLYEWCAISMWEVRVVQENVRSRETRFAGMPRRGCHIRRSRCSRLLFRRGAAQASAVNVNVDDTHYNTIAPAYSYFLLADVDSALGCGSSRVDTSSPRRILLIQTKNHRKDRCLTKYIIVGLGYQGKQWNDRHRYITPRQRNSISYSFDVPDITHHIQHRDTARTIMGLNSPLPGERLRWRRLARC